MKRVCFVARTDFETKAGGDTVQYHLYREVLSERGVESLTWFNGADRPEADLYHVFDIDRPLDIYPKMRAVRAAGKPYVISTIHHPMEWVQRFRRVHSQGLRARAVYKTPLGSTFPRAEAVKEVIRLAAARRWREMGSVFPSWRQRCQWLLENADCVLLLSQAEAEHYPKDFGVDLRKLRTRVVPNWVAGAGEMGSQPPAVFDELSEPPVLVVGRIEARKNAVRICRAMNDVGRPGVFLGRVNPNEPDYVREFEREIARGGHARWVPGVPRAQMAAYYEHAAFLLNASYAEVSPMVDIEAFTFGCPVVTTQYAVHHELLPPGTPTCDAWDDDQIRESLRLHPSRSAPAVVVDPDKCKLALLNAYEEAVQEIGERHTGI